jgi:hypothetical protein
MSGMEWQWMADMDMEKWLGAREAVATEEVKVDA